MSREYAKYREKILKGSILSALLWLGLPPLVNQLVQVSYNVIDSIWLSRLQDIALAVPRQIWPLLSLTFMIGMGISIANIALISQYVGAKKYDEADRVASNLYFFLIFLGMIIGLVFFSLKEHILLYIMHVPPEIYEWSVEYAAIISIGVPFGMMSYAFTTILQAVGDTRTPTILQSVSALMNIFLDPLLIFGFKIEFAGIVFGVEPMGVAGAALATVISRMITTSMGMYLLFKGYRGVRIVFTGLKFDKQWLLACLRIGGPVMVLRVANVASFTILQIIVNGFGVEAAAAFAIGLIVINLSDAILWGFSRAVAIMVGQSLGAGYYERARKAVYKALMIVLLSTIIGVVIVISFREPLISLFTKDPSISSMASKLIEIFALSIPFFGAFFISMSVGNGSGHTLPPSLIGLIRLWAIRIGIGYYLSVVIGLGIEWLWIAMGLSNVFAGVAGITWIIFGNWTVPVINSIGGSAIGGKGVGKLRENLPNRIRRED